MCDNGHTGGSPIVQPRHYLHNEDVFLCKVCSRLKCYSICIDVGIDADGNGFTKRIQSEAAKGTKAE